MSTTTERGNRGRVSGRVSLAALVVVSLMAAACSSSDDDGSLTSLTIPEILLTTTTVVPQTAPPTEATAPPSTEPPASTAPPTAAPTTAALATTTTEPLSVQELVLRTDGIGSARFGAEPEGVIAYVTSILGGNTGDTGWVDPFTFAACPGDVARRVDWGVLSLLFTDLSTVASGRRHFTAYEYGRVGEIGDEPVGLRTFGGLTLGSRVVDLQAEFVDAAVNPTEGPNFPANFYVSDVFYGLLTGTAQEDVVTVIFGGDGCGE